jgi:hypothetical protein
VFGQNNSGGYGVRAASPNGAGLGGIGIYATGAQSAGQFTGNVYILGQLDIDKGSEPSAIKATGDVLVNGDVKVSGTLTATLDVVLGSDCAEEFDIIKEAEPGTVMVLSENGAVEPSQNAYDRRVAGVISGAGAYKPGLILGRCHSLEKRMPIALVGKVYCKVDAQYGSIEVGDLLTTSPTAGHAMRVMDAVKGFGAVIGKALQSLRSGHGLLPILVALQ